MLELYTLEYRIRMNSVVYIVVEMHTWNLHLSFTNQKWGYTKIEPG